ncbi:alpha/beta fold hydrolase [Paenarthrobacter aurescens]|jgi:pimeloyl-ACP methyl ester carboxylesterase|uniref:Hydrolase, alpha/beta fold family domain protein n=1 Tax=Paenarthrobacter aurescens (strain TC1) TaxID=290340 RepID=A1RBL7_PAEAT|nr:alpha/beta hydrolase [Paenarthrobacter aurescens]ABM09404.1 hydrolase, alpha/beta fold family domain protein [Paenarthrobacter aurescens TC1]
MEFLQEASRSGSAALSGVASPRREVIATALGPCVARVQESSEGGGDFADVYLHGAAGSWTTFQPLLSDTPERDRVLIDLPGWGDSTQGAQLETATIEAMAGAVVEVLTALGNNKWNIVGHSMGGVLALHIAAAWPGSTVSVVAVSATTLGVAGSVKSPWRGLAKMPWFVGMLLLMNTTAVFGNAGRALIRGVGHTPLMRLLLSPLFADPAAVPSGLIRRLAQEARPASFSAAARAIALYDFGQWRRISCPVLAMRGDHDAFTPASDHSQLASLGPHVQIVTVTECGHFAIAEQTAVVKQLIEELRQR